MQTHILGFPRIGAHRELKRALENHWRGQSSPEDRNRSQGRNSVSSSNPGQVRTLIIKPSSHGLDQN
ncbi:MAG: hypothetical protein EOL87_18930, partial [Spartobacteria bacterium]|nr:hypothetical protein [Spartobacteria bacterium]